MTDDTSRDDIPVTPAAESLKRALERKRSGQAAHSGFAAGRVSEREAAATSAARSKPASSRLSKRG